MPDQPKPEKEEKKYDKIDGWLIVAAIGLVFTPIKLSVFIVKDILPAFAEETWPILTTPGTNAYHPMWAPLLIFEAVGNAIFVIASIVVAVFFFMRKKFVPKLVAAFLLSNLAFIIADYFAANSIPFVASQDSSESIKEMARTAIVCMIWVPYFLTSKRAKATFVQ